MIPKTIPWSRRWRKISTFTTKRPALRRSTTQQTYRLLQRVRQMTGPPKRLRLTEWRPSSGPSRLQARRLTLVPVTATWRHTQTRCLRTKSTSRKSSLMDLNYWITTPSKTKRLGQLAAHGSNKGTKYGHVATASRMALDMIGGGAAKSRVSALRTSVA